MPDRSPARLHPSQSGAPFRMANRPAADRDGERLRLLPVRQSVRRDRHGAHGKGHRASRTGNGCACHLSAEGAAARSPRQAGTPRDARHGAQERGGRSGRARTCPASRNATAHPCRPVSGDCVRTCPAHGKPSGGMAHGCRLSVRLMASRPAARSERRTVSAVVRRCPQMSAVVRTCPQMSASASYYTYRTVPYRTVSIQRTVYRTVPVPYAVTVTVTGFNCDCFVRCAG